MNPASSSQEPLNNSDQNKPNSVVTNEATITPEKPSVEQNIVTKNKESTNIPNDLNLSNVDGGLLAFLRRKWLYALGALLLIVALSIINWILALFVFVIGLSILKSFYEKSLFKAFASSNNYLFEKNGVIPVQTGHIFYIGHSTSISDIVSGTYLNYPFLMLLYRYSVGYGRDQSTYHRVIMSIGFNANLPTFILRRTGIKSLLNEEGEKIRVNGYTNKLNLEGDFNKHFEVFIPKDSEQDVLRILTPDVMELLLPLDKYEIEITPDGKFYLYTTKYITKKYELIEIYQIVESIINKIGIFAELQSRLNQQNSVATISIKPQVATVKN